MTYRDDLEAARARAEALERKLAESRRQHGEELAQAKETLAEQERRKTRKERRAAERAAKSGLPFEVDEGGNPNAFSFIVGAKQRGWPVLLVPLSCVGILLTLGAGPADVLAFLLLGGIVGVPAGWKAVVLFRERRRGVLAVFLSLLSLGWQAFWLTGALYNVRDEARLEQLQARIPSHYSGVVARTRAFEGLSPGARCQLSLSFGDSSCRLVVRCGTDRIYEGGARCKLSNEPPAVLYRDANPERSDGSPQARLDTRTGRAAIFDERSGSRAPYRVELTISPRQSGSIENGH